MRLHELTVTAFGPFADTVRVDFGELSAGGLFLLTGDTGSGKTSVLDAVCFALYGEVPGDRHTARHLRCDHAEDGVAPEVVLELGVGDRTFRFTRSPAWERPKRRGTGTTRVQAHVVVEEQRDGDWVALTNRLDEAGHLVTSLLGMTCTQFTQVAMLPQGRFQAFLRATSTERQAVLQRLFRTRRFEDVERWLVARRVTLHRESAVQHDHAAAVLSRVLEAADTDLPDGWSLDALDDLADDGTLRTWAHGVRDEAATALIGATAAYAAADAHAAAARTALDAARASNAARARGMQACELLAQLDDSAAEEAELRHSLEQHRRAAPVLPLAAHAGEAASRVEAARAQAVRPVADAALIVRTFPETLQASALEVAGRAMRVEHSVAETWLPREQELSALREQRHAAAESAESLQATADELHARRAQLRNRRAAVVAESERLATVAARVADDESARQRAQAGHAAAVELVELSAQLADAEQVLHEATQGAQDLREVYQDLREQRISGMAAELAVGLAAGCSCPVCGSQEHPSPATAHRRVGKDDEDSARTAWETAGVAQQAAQEAVSGWRSRLAATLSLTEHRDATDWAGELHRREGALEESTAAVARAAELEGSLTQLEAQLSDCQTQLAATAATLRERRREHHELSRCSDRLQSELHALLSAHHDVDSVRDLLRRLTRRLGVLDEARQALLHRDRAQEEAERAGEAVRAAVREAGFATVATAVAAVLDAPEATARATRLTQREASRVAAQRVLSETEVAEALAAGSTDPVPLEDACREAERARDSAQVAHRQAERRDARLGALVDELDTVLRGWAPVREQHAVTAGLAALVEGKSADNRWRMRLSAYVLSERLRQVVAAANERLGTMTDERYTLAQADEKGAGEQRGGLSLRVRDEWSGKERDPATLSGGETFLVSLALALGLADTVSHEAGGTQLDTLFVDEGFGALDATTLDGVMDVLDTLRDGGRVVGLVSHVAELRDRVPTRLEVRKARHGSTLTPVLVGD